MIIHVVAEFRCKKCKGVKPHDIHFYVTDTEKSMMAQCDGCIEIVTLDTKQVQSLDLEISRWHKRLKRHM